MDYDPVNREHGIRNLMSALEHVRGAISRLPDSLNGHLREAVPLVERELHRWESRCDMTDEDVAHNVARMRKEADTLLQDADRLEAWHKTREHVPGREKDDRR